MTDELAHLSDTAAESALIGAMMLKASVIEEAGRTLLSSDFYRPSHATIFDACLRLHDRGFEANATTVAGELGALALESIGGAQILLQLIARCPATSAAVAYVGRIKECSNRRLIHRAAVDALERIKAGVDAAEVSDMIGEDLGRVEINSGSRELVLEDFEDMVRAPVEALPEWVIPGMLRRRNRMMITAPTKTGKATMIRQIAFGASRGMHPFTRDKIPPRRVLLVDLENPRETYTESHNLRMVDRVDHLMAMAPDPVHQGNLKVIHRDRGIDIRSRSDRLLLEDALRKFRPDLLCICPIYKSFRKRGREDAEALIEEVCDIFDHLRSTYDCALVLEHHSPRGSVELFPFGSSVWERWVEFGRTMRRSEGNPKYIEWGTFCADDRLSVTWPQGFKWGEHGWPYDAVWADGDYPRSEP